MLLMLVHVADIQYPVVKNKTFLNVSDILCSSLGTRHLQYLYFFKWSSLKNIDVDGLDDELQANTELYIYK